MDYHIIFVSKIFRSDKYDKTQKNIEKTNYKNASSNKTGRALNESMREPLENIWDSI